MDLWPFSPLIFMLPPSDVSCHPLCRCCSEELPWALPGAQDGALPQGTARCPRGDEPGTGRFCEQRVVSPKLGCGSQRWAQAGIPETLPLLRQPDLHPLFLGGRHFVAPFRARGMTQPGTGETAPGARTPGQRSLACPCLCLHNPFLSPSLVPKSR